MIKLLLPLTLDIKELTKKVSSFFSVTGLPMGLKEY